MTVQVADIVVNEHPRIRFDGLRLYKIVRGDIKSGYGWGKPYEFESPPQTPEEAPRMSCLWRGYVATYRVTQDGEVVLVERRYPLGIHDAKTEVVNETLTGDFWLVFKPQFRGRRTYVPVREGRVVEDQSMWVVEEAKAADNRPGR